MAGKLDEIVKNLGLEKVISDNVSSGRSSGVTNDDLNTNAPLYFQEQAKSAKDTALQQLEYAQKNQEAKKRDAAQVEAANQMWDRGNKPAYSKVTEAKLKANSAEKEYQDYINSDEYRQRTAEREKKLNQDRLARSMLSGLADLPELTMVNDEKEMQLRAVAERARADADAAESEEIMQTDLDELATWSEEDRVALDRYILDRDQEFYNNLNPATDITFGGEAERNAAPLIEKYGQKRVNEIAESLTRSRNQKQAQEVAQKAQEQANSGFWGSVGASAASIPASALGGIGGMIGYVQELGQRSGRYKTLDPNNAGNVGNVYAGAVRGQVAQNIAGDTYDENGNLVQDGGKLRGVLSIGYQGVMSAADSVARAYLGGGAFGGAALAATGSFSQTMADASRQGATPGQAALLATSAAFIEAASEKIPLDNLIDAAKGGKQAVKQIVKSTLMQAGIEATTEEISLIGTLLAEAAILREKSNYNQTVNVQILLGASPEKARQIAAVDIWNEAVNTAFVSAVSGGASSAGMSGAAQIQSVIDATAADLARKAPKMEKQPLSPEMEQLNNAAAQTMGVEPTQQAQPATTDSQTQQLAEPSRALQEVTQGMKNAGNGATNRMAEAVMNDPVALAQLQQQSGIEITGTKAERRKAVKDALNRLYGAEQTIGTATTAETSAQPPMEWSVAENRNQNSVQNPDVQANNDPVRNDKQQTEQQVQPVNEIQQPPKIGTVGAAKSKFRHEVRESGVYANTFANANNADLRAAGEDARAADPNLPGMT